MDEQSVSALACACSSYSEYGEHDDGVLQMMDECNSVIAAE